MADAVQQARQLLPQLRQAVETDAAAAKSRDLLTQLKILMTQFPSQTASDRTTSPSDEEAAIARDILETAVIMSVKNGDGKAFERNMAQLKAYFRPGSETPAQAESRRLMHGLHLLHLLTDSQLAAFHAAVEVLAEEDKASAACAFPLKLETYLMEGSYNKVLAAAAGSGGDAVPSPHYRPYLARLSGTVRDSIAACAAASYTALPLAAAQKMMRFDSPAQLSAYGAEKGWVVDGNTIRFSGAADKHAGVPVDAHALMTTVLQYATDLDRIV